MKIKINCNIYVPLPLKYNPRAATGVTDNFYTNF